MNKFKKNEFLNLFIHLLMNKTQIDINKCENEKQDNEEKLICENCWKLLTIQNKKYKHECPLDVNNFRKDLTSKLDELQSEYMDIGVNEKHFTEMLIKYSQEKNRYAKPIKSYIPTKIFNDN
jgi:hypothetical protein